MDLTQVLVAEVVIPIPVDHPFSYRIPDDLQEWIRPGVQVVVPVGRRFEPGVVTNLTQTAADTAGELKKIKDVVDLRPMVSEDILKLLQWIADYYVCHLGEAYRLLNLAANLHKTKLQVKKTELKAQCPVSPEFLELVNRMPDDQWISARELRTHSEKSLLYIINVLKKSGLIETRYAPPVKRAIFKSEKIVSLTDSKKWSPTLREKYLKKGSAKMTKALKLIYRLGEKGPAERKTLVQQGFSYAVLNKLHAEGILEFSERREKRTQISGYEESLTMVELTREQETFIESVVPHICGDAGFATFLLHGITGSGKTEIYIDLIRKVIRSGKQAIVLIPEIVLTPQTMQRFQAHFGERVAVLHSRLSRKEKSEILYRIREDDFDVVIGPRSAVFAPFNRLGLIIVDEEHESSYKQTDAVPRYHARDVAVFRASLLNIPVVLGSATPSFESLYNSRTGRYRYYHLSQRVEARNLPRTIVVDLKDEWKKQQAPPIISEQLSLKIESRIVSREQIMLLQNRRGFSPYIQCKDCGFIAKCPNCEITLTFHSRGGGLKCHYCGYQAKAPDACPDCKGLDILFKGIGTQKIEQTILEEFPHGRVLRMDQDTTRGRNGHAKILEKFRRGESDILLGTKMIAKGLDFHRVTLVGIVSADQGLNFPDFRAGEKVFQLLIQAAGRAGRGAGSGEVVVQTFEPNHYVFKYLATQDYLKFYKRESEVRKRLGYPPFSRICLVRLLGEDEDQVMKYAQKIARYLWQANKDKLFKILGPSPAPLFKINKMYRYQILLKQLRDIDPAMTRLRKILKEGLYKNTEIKKWPVKLQIDIEPVEIM